MFKMMATHVPTHPCPVFLMMSLWFSAYVVLYSSHWRGWVSFPSKWTLRSESTFFATRSSSVCAVSSGLWHCNKEKYLVYPSLEALSLLLLLLQLLLMYNDSDIVDTECSWDNFGSLTLSIQRHTLPEPYTGIHLAGGCSLIFSIEKVESIIITMLVYLLYLASLLSQSYIVCSAHTLVPGCVSPMCVC